MFYKSNVIIDHSYPFFRIRISYSYLHKIKSFLTNFYNEKIPKFKKHLELDHLLSFFKQT